MFNGMNKRGKRAAKVRGRGKGWGKNVPLSMDMFTEMIFS
jgi:hypothetical protein